MEQNERTTSIAERLARELHADQVDKAGEPYIGHLERVVAHLLHRWPDATDDEIAAAWLHDALEDTDATAAILIRDGVSPAAVDVVLELTKPKGAAYTDWIRNLAERGSLGAVRVKLADNADNIDPARVAAIARGPELLETKYRPARALLEARLAA